MASRLSKALYRPIRGLVRLVYPKTAVVGAEKLPEGAAVIVGNHSQLHGPIACELYFPGRHATWCAGEMMALKEVPAYAYRDFWSGKPGWQRPFFRLASYLIAPLSVIVFNNADCIGVYRDRRVISTLRKTAECLKEGRRVIIFPEKAEEGEGFLCAFQEGFVDCAHAYCRQTGKGLSFVPLYVCPQFHTLYLGEPVPFDPKAPAAEERKRICREMSGAILALARALPEHRVVPYRNVSKREYPSSRKGAEA
jgi:hypothetical protein